MNLIQIRSFKNYVQFFSIYTINDMGRAGLGLQYVCLSGPGLGLGRKFMGLGRTGLAIIRPMANSGAM